MSHTNKIVFSDKKLNAQDLNGTDLMIRTSVTFTLLYDQVLNESTLIDSLKKCLHSNPYFSGRLKGLNTAKPIITACDSGTLLTLEKYDEAIACFFSADSRYLDRSFIKPVNNFADESTPIIQIKISQYQNGSILGVTFNHSVCDARSIFNFLNDWAAISRGEESRSWIFDRNLIKRQARGEGSSPSKLFPTIELSDGFSDYQFRENPKNTFRIKAGFIKNLIQETYGNEPNLHPGIKHAILPAYIWNLLTSKKNPSAKKIGFSQVYDTRSILGLDKRYFGNALALSFIRADEGHTTQRPLKQVTNEILSLRDRITENTSEIFYDIAYWNKKISAGMAPQYQYEFFKICQEGAIVYNDYTKMPIFDVRFEDKAPVWFEMPQLRLAGPRYIQPVLSPENNGDIILYATLPETEMSELSAHFSPVTVN